MVAANRPMEETRVFALSPARRCDQAAIRAGAFTPPDQGQRQLYYNRSRPASNVGCTVFAFRRTASLDDFRWAWHDGVWIARCHRRADGASEIARHRCGWRGQHPDEHSGIVDRRAIPLAGQDFHPQQPMDGYGAAVAGNAAWWPLFAKLHGGVARFR